MNVMPEDGFVDFATRLDERVIRYLLRASCSLRAIRRSRSFIRN